MKKFTLNPLAIVISGLTIATLPQSLIAQETVDPTVEEVVVTGYAKSIQNALDVKRNADTVVQAISAADIGGLPDVSIADALGRVPSITVTRSGGQASTIQIRGMGEGFVFSTLNGREQVSPNGTRAMEFSQFPSELIQSVEVYMSPKASLIEGGVAGSVELKTANPLEMSENQKVMVSVRGSFNDQAEDIYGADPYGRRLSISYQKKLFDDTLGVAVGYAHMYQPRAAVRFEHYNLDQALNLWDEGNLGINVLDSNLNQVDPSLRPTLVAISDGFELFQTGGEETRDGYVASFQYEPNDQLAVQADIFYSDFESNSFNRGFRVQPIAQADIANVILWNNIAVIGGEFGVYDSIQQRDSFNFQINNNDVTQKNDLLSSGLNVKWKEDALTLSLDLSHSDSSGNQADAVTRAHLYREAENPVPGQDPYERDPNQSVSYLLDGINLPSISMNRDYTYFDEQGVSNVRLTSYERYPRISDDRIDAVRFDVKYDTELGLLKSVETGVRYSERNHKERRQVFVYGTDGAGSSRYYQSDFSLPITTDTADIVNWKGDFSHFPSFLAIDGDAIIQSASNLGLVRGRTPVPTEDNLDPEAPRRLITPAARWGEDRAWSMLQRADIDENVTAVYLQANIETTLAGRDLTGNIGVRHVRSDQSSRAIVNVNGDVNAGAVEICDELGECKTDYAYKDIGIKYSDTLPSLNLNYSLADSHQLRLAMARVLSRAPINRLAAPDSTGSVELRGDIPYFNYGSNTSPFLKPFIADQIDLSYEWYLEETNGAIVIAGYHREIKSFIQDITIENFDFRAAGFDVPDTWPVELGGLVSEVEVQNGTYSTSINNLDGGFIRGLELSYTQTFNFLPELFSGLGLTASYSWTDSEITVVNPVDSDLNSGTLPFPGLVENSAKLTVFYSYGGFETRVSTTYQDSFVGETRNINLNPIVYAPETVVDYQAAYKFDNGLDLVFSINNLTNEPNRNYMFNEDLTRTLQWFGRTFYLGANYTF